MIPQKEQNSLRGSVDIILRDANGKIVQRHQCKNLITSSGKVLLANIFRGMEKQGVTHIGVGTNTTRPSPGDDALGEELLPRKAFDQNLIQEETNASLILKDKKGKDVIKITSKFSGERGNNFTVEVRFRTARRVKDQSADIIVTNTENDIQERFDALVMDPESENYLVAKLNEESDYVSAAVIEEGLPSDLAPTPLTGGSDITVTLASTFGYEEANGNLSEAGIFNSDNGGVMYNRVVFPEISKTDKLTLSLIWKVSF
ncbi:hypothetical protein [[Eubacterium] cellulosolvens]